MPDSAGSVILDISKANYRKILSRARERLFNFLSQNCGMVNKDNSCRCSNKIDTLIEYGFMAHGKNSLKSVKTEKIKEYIEDTVDDLKASHFDQYVKLYRDDPFYESPKFTKWFQNLIATEKFSGILQIN